MQNREILLLSHITLGYGSPEILNLYDILTKQGFQVTVSDQEDSVRKYYNIPGIKRYFRLRIDKLSEKEKEVEYKRLLEFKKSINPFLVISTFSPFLTDSKFPLNLGKYKILYASEIIGNEKTNHLDAIIAPNEDRLDLIARNSSVKKFLIYNAPLLRKKLSNDENIKNYNVLNVLYQGQISHESGVSTLLAALRQSDNVFLHICGDIRDSDIKDDLYELQNKGKLIYHGFLKQHELNEIREMCHIGFIGWREDLAKNMNSIRYCCPTKLYDYISYGMPVVFLHNYTLNKWNDIYRFGFGTTSTKSSKELSVIFENLYSEKKLYQQKSRRCISLYRSFFNYEFQARKLANYIEEELVNE
tara:strand:+ start:39352 stop:40428 length:1077 start_codon:yes stop_codon:yes gene_type:complete